MDSHIGAVQGISKVLKSTLKYEKNNNNNNKKDKMLTDVDWITVEALISLYNQI